MQAQGVVHVYKRGKPSHEGSPVSITLKDLLSLAHLTLPAAAKTLGISSTALKGVCRKLGIQRWPYWARRGIAAGASQANSTHGAQCLPVGLWDSVPGVRGVRGVIGVREVCDAGTQTDLSFGGVDGCEVPALVDAEDDVRAWWQ